VPSFDSRSRRFALVLTAVVLHAGTAAAQTTAPAGPTPPSDAPGAPATAADVAALRAEVQAMRAALEHTPPAAPPPLEPPMQTPKPLGAEGFWPWVLPPDGVGYRGYLQGQYESHQDSQDQLAQGGGLLNKDRFSVRRARVQLTGEWQYAALALELDGNTTSGPQVDLRKAEASLQYRPDRKLPPMVMATLGLFDVPFGYELVESPGTRFFMERSVGSQALFPTEPDLGVRLAGALGFFRWTIAAVNGSPAGTAYPLQDPLKAKDVVFRFGVDTHPLHDLHFAVDVSSLRGSGFHAGSSATSATIQWKDLNEDGVIQPYELIPVSGASATPSSSFQHWAFGLDLRSTYRTRLGDTKLYGELTVAQNLDRGLYIADPVVTGVDQRELGAYVGVVQEVTKWAVVGLRYDYYDPNFDVADKRLGKLLPFSEAITTWSPMFGLVLPDHALPDRARLVFQYDAIKNAFARSAVGVPANLPDNVFTMRLQVRL
jgi:Phosphate-selective porin O and P